MDSREVARDDVRRHPANEPTSVLLVDEHALTRAGVRSILELETDFEVLSEAASVDEALAQCAERRPDVVLVDLETAGDDVIEDVNRLRETSDGAAVVMLSHGDSDAELYRAAVAGAAGHVASVAEPAELARIIGRAARGDEPIGQQIRRRPRVAQRVLEAFQQLAAHGADTTAAPPLSDRELEVLRLAAEGMTNAQIGRELGLSGNTVKSVVSGILARLGMRYRTQAVVHALSEGWISLPGREAESR
jgi:DNA-binding NarL/FixJ family response regulator